MLFDLDEFECFATWTFDHHGARVAKLVGLLQEPDPLAAQLGDPGVEVGDAEANVIVQLSARADERLVPLAHVPGQHDIVEDHGSRGRAERAALYERGPRAVESALHLAV